MLFCLFVIIATSPSNSGASATQIYAHCNPWTKMTYRQQQQKVFAIYLLIYSNYFHYKVLLSLKSLFLRLHTHACRLREPIDNSKIETNTRCQRKYTFFFHSLRQMAIGRIIGFCIICIHCLSCFWNIKLLYLVSFDFFSVFHEHRTCSTNIIFYYIVQALICMNDEHGV